jgi:hypothetical protein
VVPDSDAIHARAIGGRLAIGGGFTLDRVARCVSFAFDRGVGSCVALAVVVAIAGCGWLPPDSPPPVAPAAPDPDAALFHYWKVTGHVLGPRALISDADGTGFDDRTVAVTASSYASPWSGRCEDAHRERQPRALSEVAAAHELDRERTARLGLAEPIVEYRLLCTTNRTPALTLYLAGPHALTCWSGVCYLLAR